MSFKSNLSFDMTYQYDMTSDMATPLINSNGNSGNIYCLNPT